MFVWHREAASGKFLLDAPGNLPRAHRSGVARCLEALAVSPDGSLLAVAGQGVVKVASDMRHPGIEVPEIGGLDADGYRQQGTIYVFDTRRRTATPLVGHLGPVLAMVFAPAAAGKPPLLVSAAKEWDTRRGRLWALSAFGMPLPANILMECKCRMPQGGRPLSPGTAERRFRKFASPSPGATREPAAGLGHRQERPARRRRRRSQ